MTDCFACGASFDIKFEDDDMKINFCPHCGQETVDDIDVVEDFDDMDIFENDD